MAAFVFIPGAGDARWYWQLVTAKLRERGHDTAAPDLPCEMTRPGLPEYARPTLEKQAFAIAESELFERVAQPGHRPGIRFGPC